MTYGIDTDFLVAVEILEHPFHQSAYKLLNSILEQGGNFALAPQILTEFVHVVTDERRLKIPMLINEALSHAEHWWRAQEVVHVFPTMESTVDFIDWMRQHRLGRKRLLDPMLAAAYFHRGVRRIITNNASDFRVFGVFEIVPYNWKEE